MLPTATLLLALFAPPESATVEPEPAAPERVEVAASPTPVPPRTVAETPPEPPTSPPAESGSETRSLSNIDAHTANESEHEVRKTWQAEIFVDTYYAINSNSPDNHIIRARQTAPRSGEITPAVIGGFIRHRATDEEPWWIELGVHAGAAVDALTSAEPIAGGAAGRYAGQAVFKHIALGNAGFRIRKSKTSMGAGVFESPLGLSSFWSFRNTTYTPMLQNDIVPYYLAGARISQEVPGGLTLSAWVVNGAQSYSDLNKAPSGVASLMWSPKPRKGMSGLWLNSHVVFGPEGQSIAPEDWYVLWDTTIAWAFDDHFSMAATWDFAIENPGRAKAEQNLYIAGGILARGCVMERKIARMDIVLRPDFLWDRDGRFFGIPQWLIVPSAGIDLALWERLMFRVQYRYDYSTNPAGFFYRGSAITNDAPGLARDQHTVFFALSGIWDFWFGRTT